MIRRSLPSLGLSLSVVAMVATACPTTSPIDDAATDGGSSTAGSSDEGARQDTGPADDTGSGADTGTAADAGTTGSDTQGTETSAGSDQGQDGTETGGMSADPELPGPHTWSTAADEVDIDGETIPLSLTFPDGDGPFPVVVFVHGFQLGPANYASYGAHLASWGYVVVMPQLPGTLFNSPPYTQSRDWVLGVIDWVEGPGNAADGPLAGRANPSLLAVGGHSRGGKVAMLTAAADDRPSLVIGIDPIDTTGGPGTPVSAENPSVTPELMPQIAARLALIGETVNSTAGGLGSACAPADNNFHQYFLHAASPAIEIEFVGANHMSFLDDPNCGLPCSACPMGTDAPSMTLLMTRGYAVACLRAYLDNDASFEPWLVGAPMQADVDAGFVLTATANGF